MGMSGAKFPSRITLENYFVHAMRVCFPWVSLECLNTNNVYKDMKA